MRLVSFRRLAQTRIGVVFLKHSDVVEVEIGGLGILRNPVADEPLGRE